jgi:ACS family hexuronate transporter-like MFS transporter
MAGALGGALVSIFAGNILEFYKKAGHVETGYTIMFAIAACTYLLAWIIMTVIAPKNKTIMLD